MTPMLSLSLAAVAFIAAHLLLSSRPVRGPLVRRLGTMPFQGVYSLIIFATFYWLLESWRGAPMVPLWSATAALRWVPSLVMPVAWILVIAGYTTPNPTSAAPMPKGHDPSEPVGIVRITRHPALWGQGLWALAHLPPNGDVAAALFFGSFAGLCFLGMLHIDHRRRATGGEDYARFESRTSLLPFAAILGGRTQLSLREIGVARIAAGLVVHVGFLHGHAQVIGVSAMP